MKYLPLFTLYLNHAYYADRRCPDFLVEPIPETRRWLSNYRCIAKPLTNGVRVLAATADDGALFIRQPKGMIFAFQLILRNLDFPLFTDLPEDGGLATRLYTNQGVTNPDVIAAGPVLLTPIARQTPTAPRQASGSFADVEISYGDSAPSIAPGPATFLLDFAARQAWWKYYLVTNPGGAAFRIEDQDKDTPLTFDGPIDLSAGAAHPDRVGAMLAEQYPGMRLQSFLSTRAVTCRQQARRSLQLFAGDNLALGGLPNPSVRNYAIDGAPEGAPGKGYLFQVLKYITDLGASSGG